MKWRLLRHVHISWLIAAASFAVCVGVVAAAKVSSGIFYSPAWVVAGILLLILGLWKRRVYALGFVFIAGSLIGLWRGGVSQGELAPYHRLIGKTLVVQGTVSEDADTDKDNNLVIRLTDIAIGGHRVAGAMWVDLSTGKTDIKRSDCVTVRGELSDGFGSFAASMYRAQLKRVQRPEPGDVALRVRDWFAGGVRKAISEPQASLGVGYLVGQRRALPPELSNALKIAGLTHVVVASGYNLTILVRLARRLFEKVSKYLSALSSGSMIVAFMAVTGLSPSMSRAGLVAVLSLLAWYYGRKFHPLVLLPFAAAVTLLVNPSYGWNDLGWQLSFAAFAGVMLLAPLGQAYFFGNKKPGIVRQILGETIAAQLATLPILVLAFGYFSNVAVIANLLVLPLVPLAMLLTFIAGVGALIVPAAATIIGFPAQLLLTYMTSVTTYVAHLPWAQTMLSISWLWCLLFYLILAAGCVYVWRKTRYSLYNANLVE